MVEVISEEDVIVMKSPFQKEEEEVTETKKDYKLQDLILVATVAEKNMILAYQFVPPEIAAEHIKKMKIQLGGADNALSDVDPTATDSSEVTNQSPNPLP